MKRFLFIFLSLALLCACVPTPEEDAVKQKNTNVLIQTIQSAEAVQPNEAAPTFEPVKAQLPERFTCDFTTDGGAHIEADVPIRVLSDGMFPAFRVERRLLSREERILLVKRLLDSDTLYLHQQTVTLEYIESMIAELMREPTDEEKEAYLVDHSQEELDEWLQSRLNDAAYWQERYRGYTGDPLPYSEWDGSLPPGGDTIELTEYHIVSSPDPQPLNTLCCAYVCCTDSDTMIYYMAPWDEQTGIASVRWFDNNASRPNTGTERIAPEDYDRVHDGASISAAQAVERVLPIFEGFMDLKVVDVYWSHNASSDGDDKGRIGQWAYCIRMTPAYGGAYMPYCNSSSHGNRSEMDMMRPWRYERVCAAVAGDGTLLSLLWEGGLNVTEKISETTKLLSYDEILSLFRTQMNRRYATETHTAITVTDVSLGLFRIREQHSQNTGLLVPAWFITAGIMDESNGMELRWDISNPLCIINAIDGTIIDPHIGY